MGVAGGAACKIAVSGFAGSGRVNDRLYIALIIGAAALAVVILTAYAVLSVDWSSFPKAR